MRKAIRYTAAVICASLLLFLQACSTGPVDEGVVNNEDGYSDVSGVNLEVGKAAPDFTLGDHKGNGITLSNYQGKSNVMLVFYRGEWCPFCVSHLEDIQNLFPKLKEYNVQLLGISPDSIEDSSEFAERFEQPYVFLSDPELKVTDLYGIRRDEKLPHPAVILIDQNGDVVWYFVSEDFKTRPSSTQLEEVIQRVF